MEPAGDNSDIVIPEWLLWEVLVRLPSKFAVRCKLVSKQWASLISNPLFVRSYLSHHASSSWTILRQPMINQSGNRLGFLDLDLPCSRKCSFASLRLPNIHGGQSYKIFGASNGLILFGLTKHLDEYIADNRYVVYNIYYLCNPVTGETIRLPPPTTAQKFITTHDRHCGPALVTRVRNAVLESYRVVLFLNGEDLRVSVYASEALQWKEFVLPCNIRSHHIYSAPTTLPVTLNNEILHWSTPHDGPVIAYDPYASPNHVRIIAPPPHYYPLGSYGFYCRMCNVSRGKLRYFEKFAYSNHRHQVRSVRLKLWVLEDDVWCLLHESDDTCVRFDGSIAACELLKDMGPMFFDPFDAI